MKLKDAYGLQIGENIVTNKGIKGRVISKKPGVISLNGLGETLIIEIETEYGMYECTHKEVKRQ